MILDRNILLAAMLEKSYLKNRTLLVEISELTFVEEILTERMKDAYNVEIINKTMLNYADFIDIDGILFPNESKIRAFDDISYYYRIKLKESGNDILYKELFETDILDQIINYYKKKLLENKGCEKNERDKKLILK